eukprot:scaffold451258_cov224-Attheya_sp.AAC.1
MHSHNSVMPIPIQTPKHPNMAPAARFSLVSSRGRGQAKSKERQSVGEWCTTPTCIGPRRIVCSVALHPSRESIRKGRQTHHRSAVTCTLCTKNGPSQPKGEITSRSDHIPVQLQLQLQLRTVYSPFQLQFCIKHAAGCILV